MGKYERKNFGADGRSLYTNMCRGKCEHFEYVTPVYTEANFCKICNRWVAKSILLCPCCRRRVRRFSRMCKQKRNLDAKRI